MKKILFGFIILLIVGTAFSVNYLTSFSAAIQNWNESRIDQALSLVNLSLSSTMNVSYAPDLWYFKTRLELMEGKTQEARKSLQMAATVFHPKAVYSLLSAMVEASLTHFSPVVNVHYINSIEGFHEGEIFYSPLSVAMRGENYYVLDAVNRFVEEFGIIQIKHPLSVDSTPTAMVYSQKLDSFFISFENGVVYKYNFNFSKRQLFASGFLYPVVSFVDNAGRLYISNEGKDAVEVLDYDGKKFRSFNFFKNRVHILGYIRESCGIMYVMDFTDRTVRRFDVVTADELSPIPFPKGSLPSSFEVLGTNIIFISSHHVSVGGIEFPLSNSKSSFSSVLTERMLMICDVEGNKVNMYEIKNQDNIFIPIMDKLTFKNGKANIYFRILDPLGTNIENAGKVIIDDNGFTKAINISKKKNTARLYVFPSLSSIFEMSKNMKNVVILKASSLKNREKEAFSAMIFNNVTLYLVKDTTPTDMEIELVSLTGGDFISQGEVEKMKAFSKRASFFEFEASYSTSLPEGIDEIDLMYSTKHKFVDSIYYTLQNVMK